jgi:hypothetical protein
VREAHCLTDFTPHDKCERLGLAAPDELQGWGSNRVWGKLPNAPPNPTSHRDTPRPALYVTPLLEGDEGPKVPCRGGHLASYQAYLAAPGWDSSISLGQTPELGLRNHIVILPG